MTLSQAGKEYIAQHFGTSNCYAPSGISYTDPAGVPAIGSTSDVVATLKMDDGGLSRGPNGEVYDDIVAANGGAITNTDIVEIASNDGFPDGEPQYCIGACVPLWQCETPLNGYESDGCGNRQLNSACDSVCVPSWTCVIPLNGTMEDGCGNLKIDEMCNPAAPGLAGTYEFIGPLTGAPTITLDLSALEMRQNTSDYHFEMNDIIITSTSPQNIYIALEVRLFSGALNLCPTSGSVFTGMDRVSTTRIPRIKLLDPGEVNNINADFYQPEAIRGVHTVCLLVHGAWTRQALEAEILPITR